MLFWYFRDIVYDTVHPSASIWIPFFGTAFIAISIGYLIHRHKKPWMVLPFFWAGLIAAHIFLFAIIFTLIDIPWDSADGTQAEPIILFVITLLAWAYWGAPRIHRKSVRPYKYGIPAVAIITNKKEQFFSNFLSPLNYVFSYRYMDHNQQTHEGGNWTTAVPRLDKLKVGDEIEILYDPEHPENSVWPMG